MTETTKKTKRRAAKRDPHAEASEMIRVMKLFAQYVGQNEVARCLEVNATSLLDDDEYIAWTDKAGKAAKPLSEEMIRQLAEEYKNIIERLFPVTMPTTAVAVSVPDDWVQPPPTHLTCANCGNQFPDPMQFMLYELNRKRYTVEIGVATWHSGEPFAVCSKCTVLLCLEVVNRQGIPLPPNNELPFVTPSVAATASEAT